MSYILEALKKSQAERQLGETPTIHAPQLPHHPSLAQGGVQRLPLWLGAGGLALVLAVGLLSWRPWQVSAPGPARLVAAAAAPAAATQAAPVAVEFASRPPAVSATAATTVAATPLPEPAPAPVAAPAPAPVVSVVQPVPVAPAASVPVAASVSDDQLPSLRDLPEPIQRQIPPLALGGYMYSSNPADRLLLIDKVLRHEGEEVAPGLVLEKLQPKAAIFSFKGYRYRTPY